MDPELRVAIDGTIYRYQLHGGISRIYNETLPRMCAQDDTLQIVMSLSENLAQSPPAHPQIKPIKTHTVNRFLRPRRMLNYYRTEIDGVNQNVSLLRHAGMGRNWIWHSTYYTTPAVWLGPKVVTVVDVCYEDFSDLFPGEEGEYVRRIMHHSIKTADAIICISESTRQAVESFYQIPAHILHVVPLACGDIFRQFSDQEIQTLEPTEPFILYVGSRASYKNFNELLQAFSMWSRREEVSLVVVGRSWQPAEELYLDELGIKDRVHLLTSASDDKLLTLYNQATAFIYPSLCEGFGIPLLEAMACGCPIIASRIPSTVEIAQTYPFYFEPGEPDSLISALDLASSSTEESSRIQYGLNRVREFSWDKSARQTLSVYRSLI